MKAIDALLAQIRTIADGVIAAGLSCEGKPGKQMDEAYDNLAVAIGRAYPSNGTIGDSTMLEGLIDEGLTPTVSTDYERWRCIHWPIEIPEVMENGGFDAIVGNPRSLAGRNLLVPWATISVNGALMFLLAAIGEARIYARISS